MNKSTKWNIAAKEIHYLFDYKNKDKMSRHNSKLLNFNEIISITTKCVRINKLLIDWSLKIVWWICWTLKY